MLIISTVLTATLAAAALVGVVSMCRVREVWRAAVFNEDAWRSAQRRSKWAAYTAVGVGLVDLVVDAVPPIAGTGLLLVVGAVYLMARHFRADVYLQQRVAWEEQIKAHLALPDAMKGE
jgi:hypothetical protein